MKSTGVWYGLLFLLIFSLSGLHCKKVKEDLGKKFIISAMTNGLWIVQAFTDGNTDITADFSGYEFQFKEDGKVFAIKAATAELVVGAWEGNVNDLTIFSNFPAAGEPLSKLNDTWKITNNTTKLVEAKPFTSSRTAYLKLIKKS
ncbi:hypothetical protein [Agriterribacter sp.]|uniref:hypothetical protein n=1 Tax=Agriterribacter sp. TaxID=2821509 RepID=UPI002BD5F615|nr:hypothetical protein [Agriterribacter sp.]HTN07488.1 hypothetical protein [Agriterribacter sp.]